MRTLWSQPSQDELQQFLGFTQLCDTKHPDVEQTAANLITSAASPREAAQRIYYFVRDEIKHAWAPMGRSASTTLRLREGDCWPKSVLQVALLRAVNIPARFRWIEYHKSVFAGIVPDAIYVGLSDPFPFHVLAEVYLDGRWLKSDATFDRQLRPERAHDWDGSSHVIALLPEEISQDLGYTASFEERIPAIQEFFGSGSELAEQSAENEGMDTESVVVNLYFDLIRFQQTVNQTISSILRAERGS